MASPSEALAETPLALTGTFIEKAEQFIRSQPQGVRTRDVAVAIGQDTKNVDGTLRILLDRGRIERRERRWFPVDSAPAVAEKPKTIRDYIYEVFAARDDGSTGLTSADIFNGIQRLKPEISRASVDVEVNRMKAARLLSQVGSAGRGGLYALAARRTTIRDVIVDAFGRVANQPLSTAAIYERCLAINPQLSRASVDGEVNRMKQAKLLAQVGSTGRGGLYALTNGGAHAATH